MAAPIATALRPASIRDPERHWERSGYLELPSDATGDGLVHVWLKLPQDALVRVRSRPGGAAPDLALPIGTVIERVETRHYETPRGKLREAVVDVRGVRIVADDERRWHVLRPASHAPRAPLLGWSWPVGDGVAQQEATRRLERFLRRHREPTSGAAIAEEEIARLLKQNECGRCHRATENVLASAPSPVLESIAMDGGAGALALAFEPLGPRSRDDAQGRRLCATRRALYRQMDGEGRRAFAKSFRECGVRQPAQ